MGWVARVHATFWKGFGEGRNGSGHRLKGLGPKILRALVISLSLAGFREVVGGLEGAWPPCRGGLGGAWRGLGHLLGGGLGGACGGLGHCLRGLGGGLAKKCIKKIVVSATFAFQKTDRPTSL